MPPKGTFVAPHKTFDDLQRLEPKRGTPGGGGSAASARRRRERLAIRKIYSNVGLQGSFGGKQGPGSPAATLLAELNTEDRETGIKD